MKSKITLFSLIQMIKLTLPIIDQILKNHQLNRQVTVVRMIKLKSNIKVSIIRPY